MQQTNNRLPELKMLTTTAFEETRTELADVRTKLELSERNLKAHRILFGVYALMMAALVAVLVLGLR